MSKLDRGPEMIITSGNLPTMLIFVVVVLIFVLAVRASRRRKHADVGADDGGSHH